MPSIIILDTGPLSSVSVALAKPGKVPTASQQCRQWIDDCRSAGTLFIVPAIIYYETLRELERRQATGQIGRLKQFVFSPSQRFLPLATSDLESAAQLWASARNMGLPTASNDALDGDVILAAQALSLGLATSEYIVATTNVGHIARFVPCDEWQNITP